MKTQSWIVWMVLVLFLAACGTPEEKKMAFFKKGSELVEAGELVKAKLEFKNAIQIDPDFAQAYYMLGKIELRTKNFKAAFQLFQSAIKLKPDYIQPKLELSKIFLAAKKYDRAKDQLSDILAQEPENIDALMLQASVFIVQKDLEQAEKVLHSIEQSGRQKPEFYLLMASFYNLKKDDAKALETLHEGFKLHPNSLSTAMALTQYYGKKRDLKNVMLHLGKAIEISPESKSLRLNMAWLNLGQRKPEKALHELNTLISIHPEDPALRIAAATLLIRGGQKDEAVRLIQKGINEKPETYNYHAMLSDIALKSNQIQKAETILTDFLSQGDAVSRADKIKANLNIAKLKLITKKPQDAERIIDSIIEDDPKNMDAHYLKGRLYLTQGKGMEAVTKFRYILDRNPDNIQGYIGLANAYLLNKNDNLALDVLKSGLKQFPDSAEILRAMAQINLKQKDLISAEENLKQIVASSPDNPGPIANLGDFYLSTNRYKDAMALYDQLKENKKSSAFGYLRTAQALTRQNKMDKAIDEMTRGYESNRDSSGFVTSLAQLYIKEGRYKAAEKKLKEAIRLDPKNAFAWFSLANVYERTQQPKLAMDTYQTLLTHQPDSWVALNNLAFYLAEFGSSDTDYDRALALAQKADQIKQNSPLIQDTLGWVYFRKGDYQKALSFLLKASEKLPDNDSVNYHLGAVHHNLNNFEEANENLTKALESKKPFPDRKKAQELHRTNKAKIK